MGWGRIQRTATSGASKLTLAIMALALAGCGSINLLKSSPLDLFSSSSKASNDAPAAAAGPSDDDIDCPEVQVRTGAATLMIGSKPGDSEPAALDVRYVVYVGFDQIGAHPVKKPPAKRKPVAKKKPVAKPQG